MNAKLKTLSDEQLKALLATEWTDYKANGHYLLDYLDAKTECEARGWVVYHGAAFTEADALKQTKAL